MRDEDKGTRNEERGMRERGTRIKERGTTQIANSVVNFLYIDRFFVLKSRILRYHNYFLIPYVSSLVATVDDDKRHEYLHCDRLTPPKYDIASLLLQKRSHHCRHLYKP